jgi:hypothetical protein
MTNIPKTRHTALYIGIAVLVVLIAPSSARSQDLPTSNSDTTANSAVTADNSQSVQDAPIDQPPTPAYREGSFVRALGSAKPLNGPAGPLTWHWLSVSSADFREGYDRTTFRGLGVPPPPGGAGVPAAYQSNTLSMLTTTIVLTRPSEKFGLTLQYAPTLFIVNGSPANSADQQVGFATSHPLSSRWILNLGDEFNYFSTNRVFAAFAFDVDYTTGGTLRQNFLEGAGSVMFEDVDAGLTYLWSPRTTVAFGPTFSYQHSTGAFNSGVDVTGYYTGGHFELRHMLSEEKLIGFTYAGQDAHFVANRAIGGANGNELLQDMLVTYDQALGPTWHLDLGTGVTVNQGGAIGGVGLGLTAGISKKLRRAELAVGYARGHQFVGLITGQVTDRVDAVQRFYWTKRFSTASTVSYFRTTGTPNQSGLFGGGQAAFRWTPRVSFLASISYVSQTGDGVLVPSGKRYFFATGIRWEAVPAEAR